MWWPACEGPIEFMASASNWPAPRPVRQQWRKRASSVVRYGERNSCSASSTWLGVGLRSGSGLGLGLGLRLGLGLGLGLG